MKKLSYIEQLQHPLWQQCKTKIFIRDNFTCQNCGGKDEQLHCHHRWYVSGRNAWEYPDHALVTLCKTCHGESYLYGEPWWEMVIGEVLKSIDIRAGSDVNKARALRVAFCRFASSGQMDDIFDHVDFNKSEPELEAL